MDLKLHPCPFCKSTNLETKSGHTWAFVECKICKASGPEKMTRFQAVRAWNARPGAKNAKFCAKCT